MFRNILKIFSVVAVVVALQAQASDEGKELFLQKCNMCHKTSRPSDMSKLIAPPIMGVMRHVKMNYPTKEEAIAFITDYVLNPQRDKAVCMADNIEKFGLMPSQKGLVTKEQVAKIADYLYDNYPPKGFRGMHEMQGGGMMGGHGMMGGQMGNSMMQKGGKKIKPFLIKKGLPHLTKVIAQAWDDPKLGLSDEQKAKLQEVKKETLSGVKRYSKMVNMIQNRIVSQALSGANPKDLERFVNKLASIKAEATMVHLNCIYKTRNILSKEQYEYVLSLAKKMKANKKAQK